MSIAAPAAVAARGWGWRHAGRRRWAVSALDLDIAPGERVLLLGASGSGKSTLLRGLAGILGGDEDGEHTGTLTVGGAPAADARGRAGLVLQDPDAQLVLARVGDDVAFGCENLGVPRDEIWPRVRAALDAVGLDVALDRSTSALSGGQKQRLALAGALAMRPGLLLLDEPTANLDPAGVVEVRDAVLRAVAASGASLVVVEHRVDVWAAHVDRVVVLAPADDGGGVLADGSPDAVFASRASTLTAAGVWVPGVRVPGVRPDVTRGPGTADRADATAAASAEAAASAAASGAGASAASASADPASTTPLLVARGLAVGRRAFGEKAATVVASGIDLDVPAGRTLAVLGPNGTGKSTLALTLAGLLPPASGTVRASEELRAGADAEPLRWRSSELLTRVGMVFQAPEHQLLARTVRGELEVGPRALRLEPTEIAARVEPLLDRLRLRRLAAVSPFTLSGGEKRRLTVAAALATRPRVLVLDEPTFGQDARTWRELAALMIETRDAGTALVVVTHDEPLVDLLADDILRLAAPPREGAGA